MFDNFWKWYFAIAIGAIISFVLFNSMYTRKEFRVKDASVMISPNAKRVFEFDTTSGRVLLFDKEAEIRVGSNDYFYLQQDKEINIIPDTCYSFNKIDKNDYIFKTGIIPIKEGGVEVVNGKNVHVWVISSDVVTVKEYLTDRQGEANLKILFIIWVIVTLFLRFLFYLLEKD